jgi:hypothetical protein
VKKWTIVGTLLLYSRLMASSTPTPPTLLDAAEKYILRAILIALAILALLLGFAYWHTHSQPASTSSTPLGTKAPPAAPVTSDITLIIDFGDGTQRRFTDLKYTTEMTALDAMKLAASHARPLVFEFRGAGASSIITSIEGIKDEGVGAGGATPATARAWQYWIGNAYGEVAAGAAVLKPGDRISWSYRPYAKDLTPPQ